MATNNEPLETNDKSLKDQPAAELDDAEQIDLEDASKISGGGSFSGPS